MDLLLCTRPVGDISQLLHVVAIAAQCFDSVGRQEGHPACKNWVVGCWRGYLSGARCRLARSPADATATEIQIGFAFLVPAHPGSRGQKGLLNVCVCCTVGTRQQQRHSSMAVSSRGDQWPVSSRRRRLNMPFLLYWWKAGFVLLLHYFNRTEAKIFSLQCFRYVLFSFFSTGHGAWVGEHFKTEPFCVEWNDTPQLSISWSHPAMSLLPVTAILPVPLHTLSRLPTFLVVQVKHLVCCVFVPRE